MRPERVQLHGPACGRLPELPEVDESEAIRIPQKVLRSMIDESIFAVSTNESRPVFMGSLLL